MKPIQPWLLLLALACPAPAYAAIDGDYRTTVDGMDTVLTLRSSGDAVTGDYVEGALRLRIDGRVADGRLRARVFEPSAGIDIAVLDAAVATDTLDATIDAQNPLTGQKKSARAVFTRVGASTATAATTASSAQPGTLDASLVGTWVNEKMINSGGASFASFTTVMTMTLGADGSVSQWTRSVGGGGDWNYDSAGELQYSGRWSSEGGVLYVHLDGTDGFKPTAQYRFSDRYLVTENNQGRLIWQRR